MIALFLSITLSFQSPEIRVIDGDTFEARGVVYRVADLDAPERRQRAHCEAERALGEIATRDAQALFDSSRNIVVTTRGRDRYGRTLARVSLEGRDYNANMIALGSARRYRRGFCWCAFTDS